MSQADLRTALLPPVAERYRGVLATAAGAGLRWGEVAGLRADALDLDAARLSVIRTVIEVGGHTAFTPFPKSAAGRRTVLLPSWLVPIIREHRTRWPTASDAPVFGNEVGAPLRARWSGRGSGDRRSRGPGCSARPSPWPEDSLWDATWLVDDGVPPNMVQRVMGHERSPTTLDLYTRRTDNSSRILDALNDPADHSSEDDPDVGPEPVSAPA